MKKVISICLITLLLTSVTLPAYAADEPSQKEEVVYGILGTDGETKNIYVVNIFGGGAITDYGDYSKITNLTAAEKIYQSGDTLTANTSADRLYYQGTLKSKELPWNIKIMYKLDGKEITGSDLAGKSGALEIDIKVTQNTKVSGTFYNNYALQVSVQLDTKLCGNIKADNATEANAGGSKQLTFTVLPGKGADMKITADVHDFEMKEISINGIKMFFDMDIDYSSFTSELSQFSDAVNKLDGGAGGLLDGAAQLSDGMKAYVDGIKKYKEGLQALGSGTAELEKGAAALKGGLTELAGQNETLIAGALAIQQATFDEVNVHLAAYKLNIPTLTPDNYSLLLADSPMLASLKTQLDGIVQFTKGLQAYTGGVARLQAGASQLEGGASRLAASSDTIVSSAAELYNAGAKLNSAISSLYDGLASYKKGTEELKSGTTDIGSQIQVKAEELLSGMFGNGDKTVSFVSEKNTNITSVQFVLKTGVIEKAKTETAETVRVEKPSFWQKLLNLFGL